MKMMIMIGVGEGGGDDENDDHHHHDDVGYSDIVDEDDFDSYEKDYDDGVVIRCT